MRLAEERQQDAWSCGWSLAGVVSRRWWGSGSRTGQERQAGAEHGGPPLEDVVH